MIQANAAFTAAACLLLRLIGVLGLPVQNLLFLGVLAKVF